MQFVRFKLILINRRHQKSKHHQKQVGEEVYYQIVHNLVVYQNGEGDERGNCGIFVQKILSGRPFTLLVHSSYFQNLFPS